jgi:hypothetical protein
VRWRWLVLAALLVPGRPAQAEDVWREQSQKTVEVRGFATLEIDNARGRVDLAPSTDGRLHITALKLVRSGRQEQAQDLARRIIVEAGPNGDRYRVEVRYQPHHIHIGLEDLFSFDSRRFPRYEVRIQAEVPPGLGIVVRESSGDIRSEGVTGPQVLRSTSGDVEVLSAGGRVEVSTSSGDVTADGLRAARVGSTSGDLVLQQVSGPLVASTSSGDITVRSAGDSLALSSVSGDIKADRAPRGLRAETSSGGVAVRAVSGSVRVGTASGDVSLGLHEPLSGIEVGTSSGEVRLDLDPAVRCLLDLKTSSGSLRVTLPMTMSRVSRRNLSGAIRGGKTPVNLHTASGDITVTGGGD